MHLRIISIAIASTFLAGVAAWFVARFWTFGHYSWLSIAFGSALAILVVRGSVFYRWFAVAISAGLAYRSFTLFLYLNSKGIPGEAYLFPGVAFSVCSVALFAFLLISHQRKQETIE
ncbi:MAG: hypothetical protein RIK87_16200 [Fuerstiella sp.]